MKRDAPDDDFPKPPHGRPPVVLESRGLCRTCRTMTLNSMLARYGAQCSDCFEAYCRESQLSQKLPAKVVQHSYLDRRDEGES